MEVFTNIVMKVMAAEPIVGQTNRWEYKLKRVGVGRNGTFVDIDRDDNELVTAYNLLEASNTATDAKASGWNIATLPPGVHLSSAPAGAVVMANYVSDLWLFSYQNPVTGCCSK